MPRAKAPPAGAWCVWRTHAAAGAGRRECTSAAAAPPAIKAVSPGRDARPGRPAVLVDRDGAAVGGAVSGVVLRRPLLRPVGSVPRSDPAHLGSFNDLARD